MFADPDRSPSLRRASSLFVRASLLAALGALVLLGGTGCRSWREPNDARVRVAAGANYMVRAHSRRLFTFNMPMMMPMMGGGGGGAGGMMTMQIDAWIMGRLSSAGASADGTQNLAYTLDRVRLEMVGPMMGVTIDSAAAGGGNGVRLNGGPAMGAGAGAASKGDGDEPPAAAAAAPSYRTIEGQYEQGRSAGAAGAAGGGGGGMMGMMGGGGPMGMMDRMMPGIGSLMSEGSRKLDRALARLQGLTITFRVSPDGRVVSVDNPVTLLTRLADSAGMSSAEVEQLRTLAESGVMERVATWMLESLFPAFNRGDARVGDTWQAVRSEPFGLGIRSAREFRIDDADGGVLFVGVEGDYAAPARSVSMPATQQGGARVGGMTMRAEVVGFEQGGYRIDLATGLPRRVTLREDVTITMAMGAGGGPGGGMGGGGMMGGGMMMNMRVPVSVTGQDTIQVMPIVNGQPVQP